MTRRNFLKLLAVSTAVLCADLPVTTAAAPAPMLPSHITHHQVRQASSDQLLLWWARFGCGSAAPFYRDVPRKYVRHWLEFQWEIIPPEVYYG